MEFSLSKGLVPAFWEPWWRRPQCPTSMNRSTSRLPAITTVRSIFKYMITAYTVQDECSKRWFAQIQTPPSLEEVGQVEEIITGLLQCQDEAVNDMDRSDDDNNGLEDDDDVMMTPQRTLLAYNQMLEISVLQGSPRFMESWLLSAKQPKCLWSKQSGCTGD